MEPSSDDLAGSYRLVRRLGSGAMGEVWLGAHVHTEASAAVKRIRKDRRARRLIELFERERRAIVRLSHPHIVPLFEIGESHIAMAYLPGADLARRLRTPMDPAEAIHLSRQIASALAHAHTRGVVHHDVKPGNILLDRRGNAFLSDFGLAAITDEQTGHGGGTPGYMAPEQARDEKAGPAADQYGLARTLMEMLAGTRLPVDDAEAVQRLPADLPAALVDALGRATAFDPGDRWPSMSAFLEALGNVDLRGYPAPIQIAPEVRVREPFRWCTAPCRRDELGLDIQRADYRLADLEHAGLLGPDACAEFREATGYAELGWAVFGRAGRLGPIDDASALARASEIVVMMPGWLETREIWNDIATALCRDNAQTVVLVPDVSGFGESRFRAGRPRFEDVAPPAMVRAVLRWLELLTLRDLPTVLVGHSLAGMHLLGLAPDELGDATARVVLTPVYPFADPRTNRRLLAGEIVCWLLRGPLKQLAAATAIRRSPVTSELAPEQQQAMIDQFMHTPTSTLWRIARGARRMAPVGGSDLRDCTLVVGAHDAGADDEAIERGITHMEIPGPNVVRMATGGHYPHLENQHHPEWTARNTAEIVATIDAALAGCRQGTPLSTVVARTSRSGAPTGTDATVPASPDPTSR